MHKMALFRSRETTKTNCKEWRLSKSDKCKTTNRKFAANPFSDFSSFENEYEKKMTIKNCVGLRAEPSIPCLQKESPFDSKDKRRNNLPHKKGHLNYLSGLWFLHETAVVWPSPSLHTWEFKGGARGLVEAKAGVLEGAGAEVGFFS